MKTRTSETCRSVATRRRGASRPRSLTSISEPNKVQQFQFQTSEILLFTSVQKYYRPESSRFLPCMLQCLANLQRIVIFSNYMRGNRSLHVRPSENLRYLILDLLKKFYYGPSERRPQ